VEELSQGKALGQAALGAEEPLCVTFQRGGSTEVEDAKISNRQPDKNFGNDGVASISQGNGHIEQVLLRFDTKSIPARATVTSATLTVWQVNSGRPLALRAHPMTSPWAEGSVTWSSFGAAYDSGTEASVEASGSAHSPLRTFDVTAMASAWVQEPSNNHGLLLAQAGGKTLLDTSESPHADRRPRLEVCYTEAPQGELPSGTSLLLRVVDSAGMPISAAAISSQGALFPTDSAGYYLFEELSPGRFFARVDASGYTSATAVLELREGAHVGYEVTLLPLGERRSFQAEQGALIVTEQVRVTIPPRAVVDALGRPVYGAVEVSIVPLDPTSQLAVMPGPLEGTQATSGETVPLESFFMAEVSLWSKGAPVQLAQGATATLEFTLPEELAGKFQPGDTVPAWWFDLDAGLWREEGMGTIQPSQSQPGRLVWVVKVKHFTWWNCDAPATDKSCINVTVKDTSGALMANALVGARGVDYTGVSRTSLTGGDGRACVELKRGGKARVYALYGTIPESSKEVTGTETAATCGGTSCTAIELVIPKPICTPGAQVRCDYTGTPGTEGVGNCRAGYKVCMGSGLEWSGCGGEVVDEPEICTNEFDEDCDGQINEPSDCSCKLHEGQSCYTGPAGTRGVGLCRGGTVACGGAGEIICEGQQIPAPVESCATLGDENCDGNDACITTDWVYPQGALGSNSMYSRDMAIDGEGNALLLGTADGYIDLGSGMTAFDNNDTFVIKRRADNQPLWHAFIKKLGWGFGSNDTVAVDVEGNVLVAGHFQSLMTVKDQVLTNGGGYSMFVAKFSPTGEVLWAKSFHGEGGSNVRASGVAVNSAGEIVVQGLFDGTVLFGETEHIAVYPLASSYVVKLDAAGEPLWSRSYASTGELKFLDVTVDAMGDVLLAGSFQGLLDFGEEEFTSEPGALDLFLAKLSREAGDVLWARNAGRVGFKDEAQQVLTDAVGNVVLLATNPQVTTVPARGAVMRFDTNGDLLSQTPIGLSWKGSIQERMNLALDKQGNALVVGSFMGWIDLGGGEQLAPYIGTFIAWFSPSGHYITQKLINPTGTTWGQAKGMHAGVDPEGDILVLGEFNGTVDFGLGPVRRDPYTLFLVKYGDPIP
jgi:hypothetical protein